MISVPFPNSPVKNANTELPILVAYFRIRLPALRAF